MSKYDVSILGCGTSSEKDIDAFITLYNKKKENQADLRDIIIDPSTFLGDIQYISQNMSCYDDELGFQAPYDNEPCLEGIEINSKKRYFNLLDYLKGIIHNDRYCDLEDVLQIARHFNIHHPYNLYRYSETDEDGFELYKPPTDILKKYSKQELEMNEYIYRCPCNEIEEIVFAVFAYCIMFNYHFFQCKHCKKYSAEIRHQKDRKYCERNNLLNIAGYEDKSCKDAIPQILNTIAKSYGRKRKILEGRTAHSDIEISKQREKEFDSFIETYKAKRSICKEKPSAENIIDLKDFVDGIETDRRKKENRK